MEGDAAKRALSTFNCRLALSGRPLDEQTEELQNGPFLHDHFPCKADRHFAVQVKSFPVNFLQGKGHLRPWILS